MQTPAEQPTSPQSHLAAATSSKLTRRNALRLSQQLVAPLGFWVNLCTRTVSNTQYADIEARRS